MEPKPGYMTTEFWLTILAGLVAALAAFGVLTSDQMAKLTPELQPLIATALALVEGVLGVVYVLSRKAVKVETIKSDTTKSIAALNRAG